MAIKEIGKGKAVLIVSTGSNSKKNRKQYKKTVTYKTKKELRELYLKFEAEVKGNPPTAETVEGIVSRYIEKCMMDGASQTTLYGYRVCARRINKALGSYKASAVSTADVDRFVRQMANKYAHKSIKNTVMLLNASYRSAVRVGVVSKNPCENVELPKQIQTEKKILSADDIDKFIQYDDMLTEDTKLAFNLALFCGLRRSEILGLRESDYDGKNLIVRHTRHRTNGEDVVSGTKTERSRRVIALPSFLVAQLDSLIQEHHAQDYCESDYLILHFGQPMNPSYLCNQIDKYTKRNNLPHVTLHGLRHTFASRLNASGEFDIAEISSALGHSNITTTLNIYTHVFNNASKASQRIAEFTERVTKE